MKHRKFQDRQKVIKQTETLKKMQLEYLPVSRHSLWLRSIISYGGSIGLYFNGISNKKFSNKTDYLSTHHSVSV